MSKVEISSISFAYDTANALTDVSVAFDKGLTALAGPNGSGKTTLLRCISGYLHPQKGRVLIDGREARSYGAKELARRLALVPQATILEYDFTVLDIVLMGRNPHLSRMRRHENSGDMEIAANAMRWTGVEHLKRRSALGLSGGEWQRMIIARALAQQSDILLLDEPVSSLDIRHQLDIMRLLHRLVRERELTAVCVLHDLNLALQFCDRVVLLKDGRVACDGEPLNALAPKRLREVYGVHADLVQDGGRWYIHPHYNQDHQ